MPIENNLTRIADALEALVHKLDHIGCAVNEVSAAKKQAPVAPVEAQPTQASTPAPVTSAVVTPPPAPVTSAVVTPPPVSPPPTQTSATVTAPPAPVTPPPVMTAVELNNALVVEYTRLGSRDPIDAAMKSMNVTSINDLKPEQYVELLTKVRAV